MGIVGGMTLGTLLPLFVVPTVYTLFARDKIHTIPAVNASG
jgi:multidrug efflux pump subunit AcrB